MNPQEIISILDSEKRDDSELLVRRGKLADILKNNEVAYKAKFEITHNLAEATSLKVDDKTSVAGRVVSKRGFGKFMFLRLSSAVGALQISASINDFDEDTYEFLKTIDVGDYIGATGVMYLTKTEELTVKCSEIVLLSKSLRPLPEKWHGLENVDLRFRQRYLDLTVNKEVQQAFLMRSKIISFIRRHLENNGFLEVETPILQSVASGAAAKPFKTHHNTLEKDFYLRIAPEMFLKQVVAGGFDRVFEIGKNFRNEGMDASHLQEFTMLEWYAAYWDYNQNIAFVSGLIKDLLQEIKGDLKIEFGDKSLDFSGDWPMIDYNATVSELVGLDISKVVDIAKLQTAIEEKNLLTKDEITSCKSVPALIDMLYKRKIRPDIIQPTVLYNYPACLIPLARRNDADYTLIDMFQVVVNGWEIVKAYSELVDPITQKQTFIEQAENSAKGDEEAFEIDEDFIKAMEHGFPPMSGLGLGLDRLVAIITNQETLREVVLFPQVK